MAPPPNRSEDARTRSILLAAELGDLTDLRKWSMEPGGLGPDHVRRKAWPVLLGLNSEELQKQQENTHSDQPHPDEQQVHLDTKRSFVHYPRDLSKGEKERLQGELDEVIVGVFKRYPGLSYFQGYHDIASVFYLTFCPYVDEERARSRQAFIKSAEERQRSVSAGRRSRERSIPRERSTSLSPRRASGSETDLPSHADRKLNYRTLMACCDVVSLLRLRDGMGVGLAPVVTALRLLKRVLKAVDPDLAEIVRRATPMPYFALSWVLTLFSHDIDTLIPAQRIFDFLLARNPGYVMYLGVAVILLKRERLLALRDTLDEDPGIMFSHLATLPPLIADGSVGEKITPPLPPPFDCAIFHDPDQPNPHTPIVLSELFKLTSTLYERFPPEHPLIRANELLGTASVIQTYDGGGKHKGMSIQEAAELVARGLELADVVVEPPPADSDDEGLPRRPRPVRRRRPRIKLGTGVAIIVLCLGMGIAVYQKRHQLAMLRSFTHRWFPTRLHDILRRYHVL